MEWRLFADLAEHADADRIEVDRPDPATVGDALDALVDDRPALEDRVLDEDGNLRSHVNVLRNGENADLGTPVEDDDELALFPPVSGG